ncbi:Hsp90-binding co-chaperone [Venustampulla echinocandica]|uniref:Hsp90-binding co-chaperone n=1 Tax=Venustampulla echinocandica TaxID=2656787 RepID=A0A370TP19_9HELO|nr:Hsp90-binding co-chaperone [Venustampulla echinocandica]RDL37269.1 Hsp90-binding co-chaperone [Venustampulla echinocandica]
MAATPEVLWAQRSSSSEPAKNFIYLTISVPDVQPANLKLKLTSTSLSFSGHSDSLKKDYQVDLEFYDEIDTDNSKTNHTAKNVEIVLRKKELKEEFWPRLLKDAKKVHFLKTDFDKWVDEDEQDEAPEDDIGNMGGMGGMPGMGGMGDMSQMMGGGAGGDFGGIDFSKLGGAGMGGAGDADDDEGDDDDDDEMPALEEEDAAASSSKPASKIEEVN